MLDLERFLKLVCFAKFSSHVSLDNHINRYWKNIFLNDRKVHGGGGKLRICGLELQGQSVAF